MGLTKTVTTILNNKTAAASGSTTLSDCTAVDLSAAFQCAIEALMTFNGSATQGATVKVFASADGANYDTVEYASQSVAVSAGNTVRLEFPINPSVKYFRVQVTNLDTGQSITTIYINAIVQG